MKIDFTPKRIKLTRVAIALVAISLAGYVAYAATQLSINNTGTVVLANKNWKIITFNPGATGFPTSAANCPTTGYTDTGTYTISFGSIAQGTSAIGEVCVQNSSTATESYSASTALTPTPVLPAGVTVTYSADGSAPGPTRCAAACLWRTPPPSGVAPGSGRPFPGVARCGDAARWSADRTNCRKTRASRSSRDNGRDTTLRAGIRSALWWPRAGANARTRRCAPWLDTAGPTAA